MWCDINYEFNLTFEGYYNCYPKCDNYYYFDADKNFICLNKTECPDDYNNLIEGKKINVLINVIMILNINFILEKNVIKNVPVKYLMNLK